jgi:hypothetical protein
MERQIDRGHRLGGGIDRNAARRIDEHRAVVGMPEKAAGRRTAVAVERPRAGAGAVDLRDRLRIAEPFEGFVAAGAAHRNFHPRGAVGILWQIDADAEAAFDECHARQFGCLAQRLAGIGVGETAHAQVVGTFGRCIAVHQIAVIRVTRGLRGRARQRGCKQDRQGTQVHGRYPR